MGWLSVGDSGAILTDLLHMLDEVRALIEVVRPGE